MATTRARGTGPGRLIPLTAVVDSPWSDQEDRNGHANFSLDYILNMGSPRGKSRAFFSGSTMQREDSRRLDAQTRSPSTSEIRNGERGRLLGNQPSRLAATTESKSRTNLKTKSGKRELTTEEKRLARQCTFDGCTNYTINKGRCFRHGGDKKCVHLGCTASAKIAGLCWRHGGSIRCLVEGCERRGKSRGLCWTHGGGTGCRQNSCSKVAVSNGLCWAHGGGKRCLFDGCERPAYERTLNYCPKHFARFESGEEVLEL